MPIAVYAVNNISTFVYLNRWHLSKVAATLCHRTHSSNNPKLKMAPLSQCWDALELLIRQCQRDLLSLWGKLNSMHKKKKLCVTYSMGVHSLALLTVENSLYSCHACTRLTGCDSFPGSVDFSVCFPSILSGARLQAIHLT